MKDQLFCLASEVLEIYHQHGYEAYMVGGAVRDSVLERPVDDIDIATSAYPEETMQLFEKVIPTGIKHGTVMIRYHQVSFEVTTYRTESGYSDFRRPDQVQFVSSLREDLARRDFTVNAMAMDLSFQLIDPFNGKEDINTKTLRTVGDPNKRFSEDPLRVMRAIRFQSQLNFEIEEVTKHAIALQSEWLKQIAVERIQNEWSKMLQGQAIKKALNTLRDTKTYQYLPVFSESKNACKQLDKVENSFGNFSTFIVYMNWYVPEIEITAWIRKWKLSNQVKKESKLLAQLLRQSDTQPKEWVVYQLPAELYESFHFLLHECAMKTFPVEQLQHVKKSLPIHHRSELAINGRELIQLFPARKKGPWIQDSLLAIEKAVVLGKVVNSKCAIREWLYNERKEEG